MSSSKLEERLALELKAYKLPAPEREYQFAKSIGRRWRADFAWPERMVIAEVEGFGAQKIPGVRCKKCGAPAPANCPRCGHPRPAQMQFGRHQTAAGLTKDCEKYNAAAELGWTVYRFTSPMIRQGEAIEQLRRVLG